MFGLSYFFYPWGFIVQILAIVHFVRRRPENYWLYIIFLGGFLGANVYCGAEVLPDIPLLRGRSMDSAEGPAFRHSKRRFWIIPRRETTRNLANFTWRRSSMGRRASGLSARSRPAAILPIRSISGRGLYSRRIIFWRPSPIWSAWSKGTENLTITGRRASWRMLTREQVT